MNKLVLHAAALTLAAAPWASVPALAQESAAPRIDVTGTRYDVHALCPAITDDLRIHLARRLRMLPTQALVQVAFHLDGRTIDGIEMRGSTLDARKAMRQAVQQIGCDNASAGRQRVRFDISYRWDDSADRSQVAAQRVEAVRVGVSAR